MKKKFLIHGQSVEKERMTKMPCPVKPSDVTPILREHTLKGCVHWFDISGDSDPTISSQKARPYIIIGIENPKSSRVDKQCHRSGNLSVARYN